MSDVDTARTDAALHHVRRALDELAEVENQDSVFEAQRGLFVALTVLLRMQQGIGRAA